MQTRSSYSKEVFKFEKTKELAIEAFNFKIHEENDVFRKIMLQKYISPPEVVASY